MSIRNGKFTRTNHTQATQEALRQKTPGVFGTTTAPWGDVPAGGRIDDPAVQNAEGLATAAKMMDMQNMRGVTVPAEDSKDAHDTHPECNVPDIGASYGR
jgi:hypothetical protein